MNPETDQTAAVEPPLRTSAPWRVTAAEALPGLRLRVTFVDGTIGEVELANLVTPETARGSVFEPLREKTFFDQVAVVHGAVGWPNGADLAPDAMYDAIKRDGRWIL